MTISSFRQPRQGYLHSFFIPIFAMSLFLAAILIAGCGDEGDTTEETTGSMTDVLQPVAAEPVSTPVDTVVEDPVVEAPVEEPEEEEEELGVSFSADIQPILEARCALPGCHVAPGAAGLDLSNYDGFKAGNVFVEGNGDGSIVVQRIDVGGGMPPGGPPLDADQVQLFIDWIDEGAEDN